MSTNLQTGSCGRCGGSLRRGIVLFDNNYGDLCAKCLIEVYQEKRQNKCPYCTTPDAEICWALQMPMAITGNAYARVDDDGKPRCGCACHP